MPVSTPGAPTSFAAAVVGSTVKLTWVAPVSNGGAAITNYSVESSSNGTTWSATSTQPSGTATSVSLTGISGTLSYRVKAVNSQGSSPASSVVTAQALSAPSPVGVLTLVPLDSSLRVDWSDSSTTTTSYRVEWALASNASLWTAASPSVPKPASGSAVTTTISGLTNGIAYMVRVSGENSAGIGASSIGAGTPRAPAAAPANFQVLNDNGDAVLSWTASASGCAPIVGYRIETATAGTWSVAVANTNSSATNYRVTGLAIGTTYSFRVTAITSDSYGSLVGSTSAEVSLTSVAAPTSATTITVTPKNGAVDLAWTTVADALAYRVEYSTNGVTWTNLYASTQLTSISNIS
ncbi:MAG: fibronectin type III domain-containing protein, partial [Proteobacteria bacterium]|nr:fibronectin type III domain-containing protein [Pseudomonadota bacterium]